MLIKYLLWKQILFILLVIHLVKANHYNRENLALRNPCTPINRRLAPYIKWTERLVHTQKRVQKDACGQTQPDLLCCTNEIFDSYTIRLGNEMKLIFDADLRELRKQLSAINKTLHFWPKEYLDESHRITMSSLEKIFGTKEYHESIHYNLKTFFDFLGDPQSNMDKVTISSNQLFDELLLLTYRRFATNDSDVVLNQHLRHCLLTKISDINALPIRHELLYSLTSATTLLHTLRTLFSYIDADIIRLETGVTLNSHQCFQRYVRESLCPICMGIPSLVNDTEILCEDSCRFVIKTCFEQTSNSYIAFALAAQDYAKVIKEIQESIVELKLITHFSKLHIYLYDMVINIANNVKIYKKLKNACPDPNRKEFSPIISVSPTLSERREDAYKWNITLLSMLENLHGTFDKLNETLPEHVIQDICMNSNYAVNSNRCTQIDQNMPENFTQWPLPFLDSNAQIRSNLNLDSIPDQLNDLDKKLINVRQMIKSLRPKETPPYLIPDLPYFQEQYDSDTDSPAAAPLMFEEVYESDPNTALSDRIYNEIEGQTIQQLTTKEPNANHSNLITYNIISYLFVFVLLIIHRISLTNK